jgi:hypothetical protein
MEVGEPENKQKKGNSGCWCGFSGKGAVKLPVWFGSKGRLLARISRL